MQLSLLKEVLAPAAPLVPFCLLAASSNKNVSLAGKASIVAALILTGRRGYQAVYCPDKLTPTSELFGAWNPFSQGGKR